MKIIVALSRIIVGILFIISGLIKLNDPVGFSFKLEEYFSLGVLNLPFLEPLALTIALIMVVLEVLLGVMLLLGFKPKLTVWSLLAMIVFFTFLTFYSAYFNKVTDCGCFGDAVKLTPWESFTKDIILLVLILILLLGIKHIKPLFSKSVNGVLVLITLIACILFGNHVLKHLPSKDFRPYKIGANIEEGMSIPDDAPKPVYDYAWKFNVGGEEQVIVTQGDYPTVEGDFVSVETTEVQAGYEPPIHDFTVEQEGVDYAGSLLQEEHLVMVIAYDLNKSNKDAFTEIKELTDKAIENGYKVIGMSASGPESTEAITKEYNLDFPFYFTDQTTLKTIVRSNPGVLVLNKGTIEQKVHYNDLNKIQLSKFEKAIVAESEIESTIDEALKHKLDSIYTIEKGMREIYAVGQKPQKDAIAKASGIPVQENARDYNGLRAVIDSTNWEAVDQIIAEYGYPGKTLVGEPTNEVVWKILLNNPHQIKNHLETVWESGINGDIPLIFAAELEDAYLYENGEAQIYGTKGSTVLVDGKRIDFIWPVQNMDSVNVLRKRAGFTTTIEEYSKELFGEDFNFEAVSLKEANKLLK